MSLQGKMLSNLFFDALYGSLATDVQNIGDLESLCVYVDVVIIILVCISSIIVICYCLIN